MARLSAEHPYRCAYSNLELQHGCRRNGVVNVRHEPGIESTSRLYARSRERGLSDAVILGLEVELHDIADGGIDAAGSVDETR